jgi:hypothetical protein
MRIAITINIERILNAPRFLSRRSTLLGEKTIFPFEIQDIEDPVKFNRLKSFVGTKISSGLNALLVCQPVSDGDERLSKAMTTVGVWLDYLTNTGIYCLHRSYNPTSEDAVDLVLGFINQFPVKYSKTLEEMMDSNKFLTTTETAAILSEYYRDIKPRDVRRLHGLPRERSGQRRLGYRECDVAAFIKNST